VTADLTLAEQIALVESWGWQRHVFERPRLGEGCPEILIAWGPQAEVVVTEKATRGRPPASTKVTEYQFCALTPDHIPDWDLWTVWVTRHRVPHAPLTDKWIVRSMFEVVDPSVGEWVHNGHLGDMAKYALPLDEALRLAEKAQWTLEVNGKTAIDILERYGWLCGCGDHLTPEDKAAGVCGNCQAAQWSSDVFARKADR
jgi:hypothetical protein